MYCNSEELYHHGIKGQRWGVRRYQNYDGSYTKKGLQRYNEAYEKYQMAKASGNKDAIVSAKRAETKAYKDLKQAHWKDKGKELYGKGRRIRGYSLPRVAGVTAAAMGVSYKLVNEVVPKENQKKASIAVAGALAVIGATVYTTSAYNDRAISAYYAH